MKFYIMFFLSSTSLLFGQEWMPLFDGKRLPDHNHYLGVPPKTSDVPGLERNEQGEYTEGLGWDDPLGVFSIVEYDGEPVIRISGEVIGALVLDDPIGNYHLKLKFKWGPHRWAWAMDKPRNSGILYHHGNGKGHEFNLHEGNLGSYWTKKAGADIPYTLTSDLADSVHLDYAAYASLIPTISDAMPKFHPSAPFQRGEDDGEWKIVTADPVVERAAGEWNSLELICWENYAMHIVNGNICFILVNGHYQDKGELFPLTQGRIALQSEGSEIFFKDVQLQLLDELPAIFEDFLQQHQLKVPNFSED